jgi:hypothetical protein
VTAKSKAAARAVAKEIKFLVKTSSVISVSVVSVVFPRSSWHKRLHNFKNFKSDKAL